MDLRDLHPAGCVEPAPLVPLEPLRGRITRELQRAARRDVARAAARDRRQGHGLDHDVPSARDARPRAVVARTGGDLDLDRLGGRRFETVRIELARRSEAAGAALGRIDDEPVGFRVTPAVITEARSGAVGDHLERAARDDRAVPARARKVDARRSGDRDDPGRLDAGSAVVVVAARREAHRASCCADEGRQRHVAGASVPRRRNRVAVRFDAADAGRPMVPLVRQSRRERVARQHDRLTGARSASWVATAGQDRRCRRADADRLRRRHAAAGQVVAGTRNEGDGDVLRPGGVVSRRLERDLVSIRRRARRLLANRAVALRVGPSLVLEPRCPGVGRQRQLEAGADLARRSRFTADDRRGRLADGDRTSPCDAGALSVIGTARLQPHDPSARPLKTAGAEVVARAVARAVRVPDLLNDAPVGVRPAPLVVAKLRCR